MWRSLVLALCLMSACSGRGGSGARSAPAEQPSPTPTPSPRTLGEQLAWLPATTTSVARLRPGNIFLLEFLGGQMGGRQAPCWTSVEQGVQAGYMIELEGQVGSTFAFEGRFDRDAVERCAAQAFAAGEPLHAEVRRDGDLTWLETDQAGTAVLWWRADGWVIAGSAAQVEAARSAKDSLASNPCLSSLLAELPDQPMAVARCDVLFDKLLGVPATGWLFGGTLSPPVAMDGRVTVRYDSPEAATQALGVLTSRSFPAWLPPWLGDFLAGLPASVDHDHLHLELRLTKEDFANVDVAQLQRLAEDLRRADPDAPAPPR